MAQQNYTIVAVESVAIDEALPDRQWPGAIFAAYTFPNVSTIYEKESFVRFSPGDWPQGKKVISLKLELFVTKKETRNVDSAILKLSSVTRAFDYSAVTFGSRPPRYSARTEYLFTKLTANASNQIPLGGTYNDIMELCDYGIVLRAELSTSTDRPTPYIASLEAQGAPSANPPRLHLITEDITPFVQEGQPGYGFIDDTAESTFYWTYAYPSRDVIGDLECRSCTFQWRKTGEAAIHEVRGTDYTSITIPAGTFPPSGTFEWRVAVTSVYGVASEFLDWIPLTTIDSISSANTISPKAAYLAGNEQNIFTWRHIIQTGTAQTKAELQYSADFGATWLPLAEQDGDTQSITIPADTLPGGNLQWRVRTYNSERAAGLWSDPASIVVYAAPAAPSMSAPAPVPRPVLRWQSAEQQAFEIMADDWRSGAIFGTAKEFRVPLWLSDGAHTLGVRVQSSLGLWSAWAVLSIKVANVSPGVVVLSSRGIENGAKLSWSGDAASYIIYRDGEEIGETSENGFTDWFAVGLHVYRVRGVRGEYYALSDEVAEWSRCRWGVLSDAREIDWIPIATRRGGIPSHTSEGSKQAKLRYFAGRQRPVAEVSEVFDRTHTIECSLRPRERAIAEGLQALVGRTVIYKNQHGDLVVGLLSAVSDLRDWAVDMTLTIVETDWRLCDDG